MTARGFMIAAPASGSGKTTVSLGLMRAFADRGLKVACAKSGPDYIDCAFHAAAARREGVNLDTWAMTPDLIHGLARAFSEGADLFIVEAAMGLFDGVSAKPGRTGSAADLAATLGLPVILVVDVSRQAQSAAAIVKGFALYDRRIEVRGVVLNKVASERHGRLASDAIASLGLAVLGALPRDANLVLPERHLGLVQARETSELDGRLSKLGEFVAAHVDLEAVNSLMQGLAFRGAQIDAISPPGQRIAVASDAAFSFNYPHLLASWRRSGAEMNFFSPLSDEPPPLDADVCWLPGGYPELHAGRLASARRFLKGLRSFAVSKPVHGECGGYMALGKTLVAADGTAHAMAGLLSIETSFASRKLSLGYRRATLLESCILGRQGATLLGHEFHYATILSTGDDQPFAECCDADGNVCLVGGSRRGHVSGSFFHTVALER